MRRIGWLAALSCALSSSCASDEGARAVEETRRQACAEAPTTAGLTEAEAQAIFAAMPYGDEALPEEVRVLGESARRKIGERYDLPYDATAAMRIESLRAFRRDMLTLAVTYATDHLIDVARALEPITPPAPGEGPLSEAEGEALVSRMSDLDRDDPLDVAARLTAQSLLERAVAEKRRALGSAAFGPPTAAEERAVLLELAVRHRPEALPILGHLRATPCHGATAEARTMLKALYVAEESYRAEHDRYSADFDVLGFQHDEPYEITIDVGEGTSSFDVHFMARAEGRPGTAAAGDVWTIDDNNDLQHVANPCKLPSAPVDPSAFEPLLTKAEEKAIVELVRGAVGPGMLSDDDPRRRAFARLVEAYPPEANAIGQGVRREQLRGAIAATLRRQGVAVEPYDDAIVQLVPDMWSPYEGAPLTASQEAELVELVLAPAAEQDAIDLLRLEGLTNAFVGGFFMYSPRRTSAHVDRSADLIVALVAKHRPAAKADFLATMRDVLCPELRGHAREQLRTMGMLVEARRRASREGGDEAAVPTRIRGEDTSPYAVTRLDPDQTGGLLAEARGKPGTLVEGEHLQLDGDYELIVKTGVCHPASQAQ